jgi:hypothetical protein
MFQTKLWHFISVSNKQEFGILFRLQTKVWNFIYVSNKQEFRIFGFKQTFSVQGLCLKIRSKVKNFITGRKLCTLL